MVPMYQHEGGINLLICISSTSHHFISARKHYTHLPKCRTSVHVQTAHGPAVMFAAWTCWVVSCCPINCTVPLVAWHVGGSVTSSLSGQFGLEWFCASLRQNKQVVLVTRGLRCMICCREACVHCHHQLYMESGGYSVVGFFVIRNLFLTEDINKMSVYSDTVSHKKCVCCLQNGNHDICSLWLGVVTLRKWDIVCYVLLFKWK